MPNDPRTYGLVKAAYSVNETLAMLSIGRTSLYDLVKQRHLKPLKLGRKTLFLATDLAGLLSKLGGR
jgi:hypothetical protein